MRSLFGTDGIRGRTGKGGTLTPLFAKKIAFAAAKVLYNGKEGAFLLGCDTRESSKELCDAVYEGLRLCGAYIYMLGDRALPLAPTPMTAYLCRRLGAFGVMITASHNPWEFNGIKLISPDGKKLSDELEAEIERVYLSLPEPFECAPPTESRSVLYDAERLYTEALIGSVGAMGFSDTDIFGAPKSITPKKRLRLAVDCANGATCKIAKSIFSRLSRELFDMDAFSYIGTAPDGKNINLGCGSTDTAALSRLVVSGGYDLGIAFDGDGDRCILTDESGAVVDGDGILAILISRLKLRGRLLPPCAVGTVMSNCGLSEYLHGIGVEFIRARVGDKYVYEEMQRTGAILGGESSGHIITRAMSETGDGIFTALLILSVLCDSFYRESTLSELARVYTPYAKAELSLPASQALKARFTHGLPLCIRELIDLHPERRAVVRASGTEPLIRIYVEHKSAEAAQALAERIAGKVTLLCDAETEKGQN